MNSKRLCNINLLGALSVLFCVSSNTYALDQTVTFTGGGDGTSWSDSNNWDLGVIPCNIGIVEFIIIIPNGFTVNNDVANCQIQSLEHGVSTLNILANNVLNISTDAAVADSGEISLQTTAIFSVASNFVLGNNAKLNLSAFADFTTSTADISGVITAGGANIVATPFYLLGNRARIYATNGASISISGSAAYSSSGLYTDSSCNIYGCASRTYNYNLFTASDVGTQLDLSSVQSIDAGFDDYSGDGDNDSNTQHIVASAEGKIDLSGLTMTTAPTRGNDSLKFTVIDPVSEIDLTNLRDITSASKGRTRFEIRGGATQSLPALETLSWAIFDLQDTVENNVSIGSALLSIANSQIFLSGGAKFTELGGLSTYASKGLYTDSSCNIYGCAARTHNYNLFTASDVGTQLDLSSVQSIDAGFDDYSGDGDNDSNIQHVIAATNSVIDLSGVKRLIAPRRGNDKVKFSINGGGQINLSSLQSIESANNGPGSTEFDIDVTGGLLTLGNLTPTSTTIVTVNGIDSVLDIKGDLDMSPTSTLGVAQEATIKVGGDNITYSHTDEALFKLATHDSPADNGIMNVYGLSPKYLEVGGLDVGSLGVPILTNGNFGIGNLIVDQDTELHLRDAMDNGNGHDLCNSTREALYLWGLGSDNNGLYLRNGSKLVLDGLNAYVMLGGVWVDLETDVLAGADVAAFDQGLIERGSGPDIDTDGVLDIDDNCPLAANADQRDVDGDGYGSICDPDFNNDGVIGAADLAYMKAHFFTSDPIADLDGNGSVSAGDLAILKKMYFQPPGPSCVAP